jgi:4-hydroxythreonine-4-phosphate dehydrogenase
LNPHCGEHGLFGDEEERAIEPAINEARRRGVNVVGPIGADSVFYQARIGKYRAVISLYHDQGHIAAKTYDFSQTISITWNLPFLRTSVDHGTAFDIAGKNLADATGMVRALEAAAGYLLAEGEDQ